MIPRGRAACGLRGVSMTRSHPWATSPFVGIPVSPRRCLCSMPGRAFLLDYSLTRSISAPVAPSSTGGFRFDRPRGFAIYPSGIRLVSTSCRGSGTTSQSLSEDIEPGHEGFDILFLGSDTFSVAVADAIWKKRELSTRPVDNLQQVATTPADSDEAHRDSGSPAPDRANSCWRHQRIWRSIEVVVAPSTKPTGRDGGRRSKGKVGDVDQTALATWAKKRGIKVHVVPGGNMDGWELPEAFRGPTPSPTTPPQQLLITASFGHVLSPSLLSRFPHPVARLNVHPSPLPLLRGAAPIQWAIIKGWQATGVSVQSLAWQPASVAGHDADGEGKAGGVDTGELWAVQDHLPIHPRDTYSSLLPRLADVAGDLLSTFLTDLHRACFPVAGSAPSAMPPSRLQDPSRATRAPKIRHARARHSFARHSARTIDRWQRGAGHQHPAWVEVDFGTEPEAGGPAKTVQIVSAGLYVPEKERKQAMSGGANATRDARLAQLAVGEALFEKAADPLFSPTGTIDNATAAPPREPRLLIRCAADDASEAAAAPGEAFLDIRRVKPAGRKEMDVRAWLDGLAETRGVKNLQVVKLQRASA